MLKVGSECYSLGRKTANYKGQKFFSHSGEDGGNKGHSASSKQGEEARKRGSRGSLENLSEWRNEA